MRALLQFSAAAASSQLPLPPTSSPVITATSIEEAQKNLTADIFVVLAALFCAIICLLGLAWMNHCSVRNGSSENDTGSSAAQQQHAEIRHPFPPPPKRGLKKSALMALPKMLYENVGDIAKQKECVICLTEFELGEEIRKLPQCGHEFHVVCIDRWLRSRSSCPSCRNVLVVAPPPKRGFERGGSRIKAIFGDGASTFLP